MKKYFYAILIIIIIGLSYLRFNAPTSLPLNSPSPTPSPTTTPSPLVTSSLTTDYFSLDYPREASAPAASTNPDSIEWRITYMGDTQRSSSRTQTELFDGYIVSLTRFEVVDTANAARTQANADRQGVIDACGEDGATPISEGKVGSNPALTFYGGCLGEATQYYLTNNQALYRITAMVVGPDNALKSYNQSVQNIFASLKFVD